MREEHKEWIHSFPWFISGILKVGVAIREDSDKLLQGHGITVNGCVDLRHLAVLHPIAKQMNGRFGLDSLASHFLQLKLNKNWRLRCSDWNADELSNKQVEYAALDALAALAVFLRLYSDDLKQSLCFLLSPLDLQQVHGSLHTMCLGFKDVKFKKVPGELRGEKEKKKNRGRGDGKWKKEEDSKKGEKQIFSTKKSPYYSNCYLWAPDGTPLTMCTAKRANWYLLQNLGTKEAEDPLIVRLNFEPSGGPEGDGEYYVHEKRNQCVVCGSTKELLTKYVVPHEYRTHFPAFPFFVFPDLMKSHLSHDILLFCLSCHLRASAFDSHLRDILAEECNAPRNGSADLEGANLIITNTMQMQKSEESKLRELRAVKSAGKALKQAKNLPGVRRKELEKILSEHFGVKEIDDEMVECASTYPIMTRNPSYVSHGEMVVRHYAANAGLMELERRWRQHFLDTMHPRYLPAMWSVSHNHHRLRESFQQGQPAESEDFDEIGEALLGLERAASLDAGTQIPLD
ncbi:unnamed protein product [Darwinula stevensoni]|uniref:3'-5' exonuclease domain-containing protein n=1 Tax=Darwinula stevensoni TaxID=69355 RepID=A0A7R9FRB0_9CRUS|nr:unnamed protein product [Darwinula stevensoni]CAG0901331.1 unnamed protein product [Darwinula stevensoni]